MSLQAYKATEAKIHELIHTNIFLLTQIYPPNKDFWHVFKKDMFVKNNRAAFHQVIYYLLYILNPNIIKEKLPSWPILDNNYERQFRTEVTNYLNDLNKLYEHADMPKMMASQFVSPGGYKFGKYMLKLIILVQSEHMGRDLHYKTTMLNKPTVPKNGNDVQKKIKQLNSLARCVNRETENQKSNFLNNTKQNLTQEAEIITNKLTSIQEKILLLQEKLKVLQLDENKNQENNFSERLDLLLEDATHIQDICIKLSALKNHLTYLSRRDLALEHQSKDLNDTELDLNSLFKEFSQGMEKYCLEMKIFTDKELDFYISKFTKCNEDMSKLQTELIGLCEAWRKTSNNIQNIEVEPKRCRKHLQMPSSRYLPSSSNSTELAIPLDCSDTTIE